MGLAPSQIARKRVKNQSRECLSQFFNRQLTGVADGENRRHAVLPTSSAANAQLKRS